MTTKIKLSRERVNEYNVRHVCEGTKYLPKCYASGGGYHYSIYSYVTGYAGGELIKSGYSKYGSDLRTLSDVREWIAAYDEAYVAEAYADNAEIDERTTATAVYIAKRAAANKLYTTDAFYPLGATAKKGERITARFAHLNKNCTLGEYVLECEKPEDYTDEVFLVNGVVELSNEEYDNFAMNLLAGYDFLGPNVGGSWSDAAEELGVTTENFTTAFSTMSKENREKWYDGGYRVGVVVKAPARNALAVDPSGYNYARYVGFVC